MNPNDVAENDCQLTRVRYSDLPDYQHENWSETWSAFYRSCESIAQDAPELRRGVPASAALRRVAKIALGVGPRSNALQAQTFFEQHFEAFQISSPDNAWSESAFFTAYYQPEVSASPRRGMGFEEPIFERPADLITLQPGDNYPGLENLSAARQGADGKLQPYPTRSEIDGGALGSLAKPVAYVADAIEAYMIQVQGSARLLLPDGDRLDLTYAGRNGHPYTSIGRVLIDLGEIKPEDMSLARLKEWVRSNGQGNGQKGRSLLHRNRSFVFFSASLADEGAPGPIGAAGVPLTPYRSIAIDRSRWSYGLPFWVDVTIPWKTSRRERFARMVIGQDTGSAIVGPARADLYFGSGLKAGDLAGGVRHGGRMFVLLPREN